MATPTALSTRCDSSGAVYVLHVFQKKSPRGIETRQSDIDLVRRRLRVAQQDYEERYG